MGSDPGIEIRVRPDALEIPLLVVPGSSRERVLGEHDGRLRVAVTAPPERGAANRAVVKLLARVLGVKRGALEIVGGAGSRRKSLHVDGLGEPEARARLTAALEG